MIHAILQKTFKKKVVLTDEEQALADVREKTNAFKIKAKKLMVSHSYYPYKINEVWTTRKENH